MTPRKILFDQMDPSLVEYKEHIHYTADDQEANLQAKLAAAIQAAEHFIGRVIALSEFTLTSDFTATVTFPEKPFVGVSSVKVDGSVVSSSNYSVKAGSLAFAAGVTGTTMEIVYKCGMTYIPFDMKAAILMHAATLFLHPEDSVEGLPKASTNLLRPYRNWELDD